MAVVVAALCGALAWSLAAAVSRAPAAAGDALLPDLREEPLLQLDISGNDLLISQTVSNQGVGPMEVYPEVGVGGDCNGDGDVDNDRIAFQRIYLDSSNAASPGYFVRGQDTASTSQQVGCMIFHPTHNHWHFDHFARYLLRSESTGAIVARTTKVSFCILDSTREYPGLPGSPSSGYYGTLGCGPDSPEGLSIGWSDTYGAYLPGQNLDVTGLPAGDYCVVERADPRKLLTELSDRNNRFKTRIHMDLPAQTVEKLPGNCVRRG